MRRKEDHEEHLDESWLIPYADLLTLLLALFIVLFASSTVDQELLEAMQSAFNQEYAGQLPGSGGTGGGGGGGSGDGGAGNVTLNSPGNASQEVTGLSPSETATNLISLLEEEFSAYVDTNNFESEMTIEAQPEGLLITLTSDVWFASGSAEINDPQKKVAAEISKMIANIQDKSNLKLSVIVSGHTDNVPIGQSEFKSNWSLSVTRAVNFMEELMNTSSLQPSNFSARGFGEFEPIAPNDTADGRQKNRRVEVMISPQIPLESQAEVSN